ncbi:hypothetical protein QBC38DRAFT_505104 [Podospora fimiseda]|uniref:Uncharacterized protein n=1 Tax=Podospora fimiseda TaxID=252190 RepID=A0AAN7BCY2_9PEZI|nr:hypothetical protein QBC38DRAFT_505104 [Podospora fimiseda]
MTPTDLMTPPYDLSLYSPTPILINLHYTLHWSTHSPPSGTPNRRQIFPPQTFAALLPTDSTTQHFLSTLHQSCLNRIRSSTRFTSYAFTSPINCEAEFNIIYSPFNTTTKTGGLSIRTLSTPELSNQLHLIKLRNYQDVIRADMAIEIDLLKERNDREMASMQQHLRGIASDCLRLFPALDNQPSRKSEENDTTSSSTAAKTTKCTD